MSTSSSVVRQLASGDLNNDGVADVVVGGQNVYTVFLNDGAGGFVATETSTPVPALSFVMLGDLDSDGNLDMIADDPGNTVPGGGTPMTYRFLGDGHGGFGASTALGRLEPRALGDLDEDGHPDLVSLSPSSAATVRLGDGSGGFASPIDYPIPAQETFGFGNTGLADFDADGHLDLVAAGIEVNCSDPSHCSFTPKVVLMLGDGTGALTAGALRTAGSSDLAVGDFNEDGHLDVITTAATTTLSFLAGTGTADLAPAVAVTAPRATCEVETGDIDADGHLDLVVAFTDHDGWVLFGDGTGQFPATHGLTTAGGSACNHALSRNLDADPKPDVIYMSDGSPGSSNLVVSINALNGRPSH